MNPLLIITLILLVVSGIGLIVFILLHSGKGTGISDMIASSVYSTQKMCIRDRSFTAEVKDELARVPPTCSHCEKATLAALVRIEGTLFFSGQGKYRIEIATDVPSRCV